MSVIALRDSIKTQLDTKIGAVLGVDNSNRILTAEAFAEALDTYFSGSSGDASARLHYLSRVLPTVVNNYIEIGKFSLVAEAHSFRVSVTVSDSNFSGSNASNRSPGTGEK